MKPKKKSAGWSQEHKKEIYGLVFLAIAAFLAVCLFSYNSQDPSFSTLAVGRKTQNLGGVAGAYMADIFVTLFGFSAYLLPLACLAVSLTQFSQRNLSEVPFGWARIVAYGGVILLFSLFCHLYWGEVEFGKRLYDAGGVVGWGVGGWMDGFLGRAGSYLLVVSGILLGLLVITQISLVRLLKLVGNLCLLLLNKGGEITQQGLVVTWARLKLKTVQAFQAMGASFKEWRQERESLQEPIVHTSEAVEFVPPPRKVIIRDHKAAAPEPAAPVITQAKPVSIPSAPSVLEGDGPKILPRVDLKEDKKRDQLELVSPMLANYQLPQVSFLDSESQQNNVKIDEEGLKLNSKLLEKKLMDYGVEGRITEIHPGPIITMYEFEPAAGVKVNKIVNLEDDLSLTMGGKSVRIIAPLPGKPAVGIEIPNNDRETVWLKDVIGHAKFQKAESKLTLALGKDTEGIPYAADLGKMPHLLVAGATGMGKSVQINSMILSLLYKATPEEVRLIMVDPKMLELSIYQGIPHLLLPVVTQPKKAAMALRWGLGEMERRYELLSQKSARNIAGYNKLVSKEEKLPYIVIIIDELADLMMTAAKEVETSITRLAQMARAAGIHLILATQRPSVDVITGLIKANFPARISFKVSSKHDSRTILDTVGSEHLLGNGDMLFMSGGTAGMMRVHGAFVSETEILRVVEHWKNQGQPQYLDESVLKPVEDEEQKKAEGGGDDMSDDLYDQAVAMVSETRQASISMIQRRMRIGYNRAARMIERMEKEGVVGPADGARPREVYANNLTNNG